MTEKVVVNSETGEVSQFKFLTMWTGREKTGLDYSRKTEKRFKEVPPYAVDLDGKIINKKSVPVLVEDEPFDVDEYIQSFKDETDIYTILEKFAMTGCTDTTLINKGVMSFGDISELPDNINEMNDYYKSVEAKLNEMSSDLAKQVLDDSISIDKIHGDLAAKVEAAKVEAAKVEAAKDVIDKKDEVKK